VFGADNASGGRECLAGISRRGVENMAGLRREAKAIKGDFAALPHENAADARIPLEGIFGTI
jgi:hypothetical protein